VNQVEEALANQQDTMLTRFFDYCRDHPDETRNITYASFPEEYIFEKVGGRKRWRKRRNQSKTIGRLYNCSPRDMEKYCLRLLLMRVQSPKSFEDIKIVEGVEYSTYREAAVAYGLLNADQEWNNTLTDGATFQMQFQLRALFVAIVIC
jgi:hypothetical protein